jgi:hypothetical protein
MPLSPTRPRRFGSAGTHRGRFSAGLDANPISKPYGHPNPISKANAVAPPEPAAPEPAVAVDPAANTTRTAAVSRRTAAADSDPYERSRSRGRSSRDALCGRSSFGRRSFGLPNRYAVRSGPWLRWRKPPGPEPQPAAGQPRLRHHRCGGRTRNLGGPCGGARGAWPARPALDRTPVGGCHRLDSRGAAPQGRSTEAAGPSPRVILVSGALSPVVRSDSRECCGR